MKRLHTLTLLAAATLAAATTSYAQDLSASSDVVQGAVDGHVYRNGGVGAGEAEQMRHDLRGYTLLVALSEGRHNAYLADVKLDVFDTKGRNVFSLQDAGPLVDVQLPAGHYRIVAESAGVRRTQSVDVSRGEPARVYLHWASGKA